MPPRVVVDTAAFGDWERNLHRNDKHQLRDCRENIITILENHEAWRGKLVADVFSKRIVTAAETPPHCQARCCLFDQNAPGEGG